MGNDLARSAARLRAGYYIYVTCRLSHWIKKNEQKGMWLIMVRMIKYRTKLTENKRVVLEKEVSINYPTLPYVVRSPEDAAIVGREFMRIHELPEEYMYMFCLNTKNKITGVFEISHGSANSSIVRPREIFQKALLANAISIILMHNHPSGDPKPSKEDVDVTKRIIDAGKIVGVEVLDHIIIGETYVSMLEKGYM